MRWIVSLMLLSATALMVSCGDEEVGDGSFGSVCEVNEDCDTSLCFEFGSKGNRCTSSCPANPSECPNDGAGCNDKGVCKVP